MNGVDIILSPVAFTGERHAALQFSGMWQETQQNKFFTVESGFNGSICGRNFWGESFIHAPLEMTKEQDGYLARSNDYSPYISVELDNKERNKAIHKFDVLSMLNLTFCRNMKNFGGTCVDN